MITQTLSRNLITAIDPDLHRPGVAIWDLTSRKWLCHAPVHNDEVKDFLSGFGRDLMTVYIEAGWKHRKANFRGGKGAAGQSVARNIGENHAMGKFLSAQLTRAGFHVIEIPPLKKGFMKVEGKWTPLGRRHLARMSGITARINDDVRDAVFIAIHKK